MKATSLLKRQHRKVEATFTSLEKRKGDVSAVLAQLANDLAAHMAIEQTVFYPAVREIEPDIVEGEMDAERLEAMGAEMQRAFEAALEQGYESLLPEGFATSADRDETPASVGPRAMKGKRMRPARVAH